MVTTADMIKSNIMRDFRAAVRELKAPADNIAAAQRYAQQVGQAMVEAFRKNIGDDVLIDGFLTKDAANALIRDPIIEGWKLITGKTAEIQTAINAQDGLHIRALQAGVSKSRVNGMATLASSDKFEKISVKVYQATPNVMRAAVDKTVQKNFTSMAEAGVDIQVVRTTSGKCCEWCEGIALAGPYDYDDVKRGGEVWQRHLDCNCVIETRIGKRSQRSYVRLRDDEKQREVNAEISEERRRS